MRKGQERGWEVCITRWRVRWEHRQFSPAPAGGDVSPGLPALGCGPSGRWASRCFDLRFVTWNVYPCPLERLRWAHVDALARASRPGDHFLTVLLPRLYRFQCFFAHLSSGFWVSASFPSLLLCLALPVSAPPLSHCSLVQLVPISKINHFPDGSSDGGLVS